MLWVRLLSCGLLVVLPPVCGVRTVSLEVLAKLAPRFLMASCPKLRVGTAS